MIWAAGCWIDRIDSCWYRIGQQAQEGAVKFSLMTVEAIEGGCIGVWLIVAESIITIISTIYLSIWHLMAFHGRSDPWFGKAQFHLDLAGEPSSGLVERANADVLCIVIHVVFKVNVVVGLEGVVECWLIANREG